MTGPVVALYAGHPHYMRHLRPIGEALRALGVDATEWSEGSSAPAMHVLDAQRADVVIVASREDACDGRWTNWNLKPVVYVEHGAGQTYVGTTGKGHPGGPQLEHVRLFLCPNEHVAEAWRSKYSKACVVTVGCPALDVHFGRSSLPEDHGTPSSAPSRGVVAFTWHWDCQNCPELRPALPHYEARLPSVVAALRAAGLRVVGSAHPKAFGRTRRLWKGLGVEYVADPDDVIRMSSLLVADNTSLLYEAAACGVPTLSLNAPWYRRDVEHGLRFWSHVPGYQCDHPDQLEESIRDGLRDGWFAREARADAVERVYGATLDGQSARRAAEAIVEFVL